MSDKIELLMEETGCERGEAELALEMCGYDLEAAARQLPHLLRDICALKGKFLLPSEGWHGLFLVVLNLKTRAVLRSRAVMSFDPAVCAVSLDEDWFAFERHLYGCRLWEGSLPDASLEIEQRLAAHFRAADPGLFERLRGLPADGAAADAEEALRAHFRRADLTVRVKKDILDLGQFRSLRPRPAPAVPGARPREAAPAEDILVLRVALEEDPGGTACEDLRAGDLVQARVADGRDIALYLARLLGGLTEQGPLPIEAPVEAVESSPEGSVVRVRFAVGVCGDAALPPGRRVKAARAAGREDEAWWRRLFKA